jgi:ATP-dependent 26S proteasome regulatory subunit
MFAIRAEREQISQADFNMAVAKVLPPSRIHEGAELLTKPEKMFG